MIHAHDSFSTPIAAEEARSIGAILAALPQIEALRSRVSRHVNGAGARGVVNPALRGNLA